MFGICLLGLTLRPALATQSVALVWNPSTDSNVAGYRIYYGTASHNYTKVVTVGNVTNTAIAGLVDGTTYFFAATTTDAVGNESGFSNEASFTTAITAITNQPPTLDGLANLTIYQNAGSQTIALTGITSGSLSENQVLRVTVVSSNPNLITKPAVTYISPNATGTLVFRPAATLTGTSIITVTVNDGGKSNNIVTKKFVVTVIAPPNPLAPRFSRPLANSSVTAGQTISLSVAVTGKAPFRYQWKFNGNNLSGATSATLTLRQVQTSQAGAYSVTVSNGAGSTNGFPALLSVYPTTAMQGASGAQTIGGTMAAKLTSMKQTKGTFTFTVTGIPGSNYVVQASSDLKNWTDLETNTSPFTFTDTNAGNFNQQFYRTCSP
jgi:hypothetical protein